MHLTRRGWRQPEDFRYAAFRRYFGSRYWLVSLVQTFYLQALLAFVVGLPLRFAVVKHCNNANDDESKNECSMLTLYRRRVAVPLGIGIGALGVVLEAVADWQLDRFIATRRSSQEVLDAGLWRLSRHPNYFGNALIWWGLFVVATSSPSRAALATVVSPLLMQFLLMRVSGVTLLEKTLAKTKPQYARYAATTPAFFPSLSKLVFS
jgi:steroid 5-alpha reductase family enzyme